MSKSKVYFTWEITPDSLVKMYEVLNHELKGKVAVKISTGEPGGHNYLHPELIGKLVKKLDGIIVECNTAYAGRRNTTSEHWKAIDEHGFKTVAPVDIMDEDGDKEIPVPNGFHLKHNLVGTHIDNYDSILMLSHFKGHMMAGMGGALKNMSIGMGSSRGKCLQHSAGVTDDPNKLWDMLAKQDDFLESMADADASIMEYMGRDNIVYINVANRLSVDCDCDSNPHEPEMADIGIFASLDPVAIDQACYDAVHNSEDEGKAALIERMESRHAIHTVEAAAELGLGSRDYEIVNVD